mgnify:CR=1 FL=1
MDEEELEQPSSKINLGSFFERVDSVDRVANRALSQSSSNLGIINNQKLIIQSLSVSIEAMETKIRDIANYIIIQQKEIIFSPFKADGDLKNALVQTRDAVFRLDGSLQNFKTQIYRRNMLPTNVEILGPAILLQKDSTTVVPPNATAKVHSTGNIIISLEPNS